MQTGLPLLAKLGAGALAVAPEDRPASARAMQTSLELFTASRGMEGTRAHLSDLLHSVLPPERSAPDRVLSRLTQQLQNLTRVVTGPADSSVSSNPSPPKNSRALLLLIIVLILALVPVGAVAWRLSAQPSEVIEIEPLPRLAATKVEPKAEPEPPPVPTKPPEDTPPEPPAKVAPPLATKTARPKTAPRAKTAPKRRSPGRLTIDTRPWTEVFLEGRRLGMTPLQGVKLPAGRHRLRLSNGQAGIDTTVTVKIRPGRETRLRRTF